MKALAKAIYFLAAMTMLVITVPGVRAEVAPGDVIGKDNYQKIEGLVPDFIFKLVQDGDLIMTIGELPYNPSDFLPPEFKEKTNIGRYQVVENNCLKDVKQNIMNPHPHDVTGFPFPEPDVSDPTAPLQMLHNFNYFEYHFMPWHYNEFWMSVSGRGMDKLYEMEMYRTVFDKGSQYDHGEVSRFRQPFDIAGTGSMVNYYIDPMKNGLRYVYAPMIRKVKRMSHRLAGSENNFDLDLASDDNWAGGPRTDIENGRYKFLRQQVALVPYIDQPPAKAVINSKGEIETGGTQAGNLVAAGTEVPEWKGGPWHIPKVVWVKRGVYVFESTSVNPNYRYGPCEGWVEQETFVDVFKQITDPNGNLWKGSYRTRWVIQSDDHSYRDLHNGGQVVVDMKRNHGSAFLFSNRKGGYRTVKMKEINTTLFTRSGFVKFTK